MTHFTVIYGGGGSGQRPPILPPPRRLTPTERQEQLDTAMKCLCSVAAHWDDISLEGVQRFRGDVGELGRLAQRIGGNLVAEEGDA